MKLVKNPIFTFILGIIVAGTIGVFAIQITANDVTYSNTTVKSALDTLYTKATTNTILDTTINITADKILSGNSAYNGNGTLVNGNIETYTNTAQTPTTVTPTTSQQVLPTNGKYISSDITINAIPSSYKELTTTTTVAANKLLNGETAYDNLGNLITGTISTNCVKGTYHHAANTNWNIDFGITPTRFFLTYVLTNNRLVYYDGSTIYNFIGYTTSSIEKVDTKTGTISGTSYIETYATTTGHYKNAYDITYYDCR